MPIKKEVIIGDCRLILGDRKKIRAAGHKKALKLYPVIGDCVKCGDKKAERHHIDDNPTNNAKENIMPLCRKCHSAEHGKTVLKEVQKKGCEAAAKRRKSITHCPKEHPYSGDNLYITPDGKRVCKECNREAKRRYNRRKRCEKSI